MKRLITILLLIGTLNALGQEIDSTDKEDELMITYIEGAPSFPGGQEELNRYIEKKFKWRQGQRTVEGKVFVEFWIENNGQIKDAKVVRGLCDTCDKEALRLVSEMPKWTPATQKGKPIRVRMVLPIKFGL